MKAVICETFGPPESLVIAERPDPVPLPTQILLATKACALNYPDALIVQGKYQVKPPLPFIPGSEVAGVVEAVGRSVTRWRVGDSVIAATGIGGGLCAKIALDEEACYALPAGFDFAAGAAFLVTYSTALHALKDRARLAAGETVLVLGAAGGVGLAAVHVAKLLGAHVIAVASTPQKAARARAEGADKDIVCGRPPLPADASKSFLDAIRRHAPQGLDVVVDPVGGNLAETVLRAMRWAGRYLIVGFASGEIPRPPLNLALLKGCDIAGVSIAVFSAQEPERRRENADALYRWAAAGKIKPVVSQTFLMSDSAKALRLLLEGRTEGKIVVVP